MTPLVGVTGMSQQPEALGRALELLRAHGYSDVQTYSPFGSEIVLEGHEARQSPIRLYTLGGGIVGLAVGLAMTIGMTLDWPLITGGKPMVSLPAFLVICFELTMLLAGLATFAAFLVHSGLLGRGAPSGYRPRFGVDRFGILVRCSRNQTEEVQRVLLDAGLEEVSVEEE